MTNESQALRRTPMAGVIVTHADLARALHDAAATVAGDVTQLLTVSNEGLTTEALTQRVQEVLDTLEDQDCIVFVDFRGGSCAQACLDAITGRSRTRLITGVNLPMIIDFILRRDDYDLDGMAERLLQRGRKSVQLLRGSA